MKFNITINTGLERIKTIFHFVQKNSKYVEVHDSLRAMPFRACHI